MIFNKRFIFVLGGGVLLLALLNLINDLLGRPFWTITRIIYLGYDNNFSAWYSSMLLFISGMIFLECYFLGKKDIQNSFSLLLFSLLLFFMSSDEISQFHEIIGGLVAKYMGISSKSYAQHSSWVWIGGPIILIIFMSFLCLLKKAFKIIGNKGILIIGLGFSSIILGGVILEATINFLNHQNLQWIWDIEVIIEESLEMLGSLLIAYAGIMLLDSLKEQK